MVVWVKQIKLKPDMNTKSEISCFSGSSNYLKATSLFTVSVELFIVFTESKDKYMSFLHST